MLVSCDPCCIVELMRSEARCMTYVCDRNKTKAAQTAIISETGLPSFIFCWSYDQPSNGEELTAKLTGILTMSVWWPLDFLWFPVLHLYSFRIVQRSDVKAFSWSLSVADFLVILPPVETGRAGRLTKQGKKTCKGRTLESFGEEVREWRVEVVRVDKNGEDGCVKEMVQCGGPLLNKWGGLKGDFLVHLRIKEKGNGVVLPS